MKEGRKCHILKPENLSPNQDSNLHSSIGCRLEKQIPNKTGTHTLADVLTTTLCVAASYQFLSQWNDLTRWKGNRSPCPLMSRWTSYHYAIQDDKLNEEKELLLRWEGWIQMNEKRICGLRQNSAAHAVQLSRGHKLNFLLKKQKLKPQSQFHSDWAESSWLKKKDVFRCMVSMLLRNKT